ncbi:hypothetical protein HanRHA438_Chr04g0164221 [Helianthus annuus]|nr:hypothetical protein HanRHA438_Chr04g0164221 [Helianthus annuus]
MVEEMVVAWCYANRKLYLLTNKRSKGIYHSARSVIINCQQLPILRRLHQMERPLGSDCEETDKLFHVLNKRFKEEIRVITCSNIYVQQVLNSLSMNMQVYINDCIQLFIF